MEYSLLSDELLAKLLKTDDDMAFKEIYNRYWKRLYFIALCKTHNKEVAEELIQNIFISLWEKRSVIQIDNVEAYLIMATKYRVINYIQSYLSKERHLKVISNHALQEDNNSETQTLLHELSNAIHIAIEKLPPKTKTIFKLSREEYRTIKEIATLTNLSEKAVEYHITQSLKLMRIYLKDFIVLPCFLLLFQLF